MTIEQGWWRWSRIRDVNPFIVDSVLAAVLFVLCAGTLVVAPPDSAHHPPPVVFGYLLVAIGAGCLAFRRRYPLTVLVITAVATTMYVALHYPDNGLPLACLVALYTVGTLTPRPRARLALVVTAVTIVVNVVIDTGRFDWGSMLSNAAIFGGAYLVGDNFRVRRAYLAQLELRAADLERTRNEEAERAVTEERLRIARELHDVVAHAMSVVAVQSGVAAHVIDRRPDEAKQMIENISQTSRDALDEMRRLLGVLRADSDSPAVRAPVPTLELVGDLVATIERAGVPVRLTVEGDRGAVPAGVDLSAYRIVQEALTNVLKHAGSASAEVLVRYEPDEVIVQIIDDGRGAASIGPGGGHGLVGMRERVGVYGGTFQAGPRPGGGFGVLATLPLSTVSPVRAGASPA